MDQQDILITEGSCFFSLRLILSDMFSIVEFSYRLVRVGISYAFVIHDVFIAVIIVIFFFDTFSLPSCIIIIIATVASYVIVVSVIIILIAVIVIDVLTSVVTNILFVSFIES